MIHSLIRFGLPIAHVTLWPYVLDVWYIGLPDLGSRRSSSAMFVTFVVQSLTRIRLSILDVHLWPEYVLVMMHSLIIFGPLIAHVALWPYLFDA